jgi:uroporphyrin-III C-methyltransferase
MKQFGKVYLVGAGPGDPELLTIKAAKAIACADVILIDDLVNPAVLEHAPATARVVKVGKRGGCKQTPQEFIERLMLSEAQDGNCVVRLKGGDPFIFGRGGEERDHLQAEGIEVDVINGISSGLAAPASIGGRSRTATGVRALSSSPVTAKRRKTIPIGKRWPN